MSKNNSWRWFSVKLIFEHQITGEPEKDLIDKNYTDQITVYEESIILVKARSFEHAYKIAEKKALEREEEHVNPYGQIVRYKFAEAIDCFDIEDGPDSGVEVYSRFLRTPKETSQKDFLDTYYPETMEDGSGIDYNFILRYRKFNTPEK